MPHFKLSVATQPRLGEIKDGEEPESLKVINFQDLRLAPTYRYLSTEMIGLSSELWLLRVSFGENHCFPKCGFEISGTSARPFPRTAQGT
jgi:hypothetical protein